jgi:predicted flavoprotein YhiN
MLPSIFHKFDNNNMQKILEENNIETQIENNGRIILKS